MMSCFLNKKIVLSLKTGAKLAILPVLSSDAGDFLFRSEANTCFSGRFLPANTVDVRNVFRPCPQRVRSAPATCPEHGRNVLRLRAEYACPGCASLPAWAAFPFLPPARPLMLNITIIQPRPANSLRIAMPILQNSVFLCCEKLRHAYV